MYEPGVIVNTEYGPQPAPHVLTMFVARLTTGLTDGVNEPVPTTPVPAGAGNRMASNGEPETIGAVPPV